MPTRSEGNLVLRLEPRQRQQILDDLRHAPRLVAQLAQDRLVLLHLLGLDQIEITVHDRQRRAQLVRDVRDEIATHLLEAHQLADIARDQQRTVAGIADQAQIEPQGLVAGRGQVVQRIDAAAAQPVDDARRAQEIRHVSADVLRILEPKQVARGRVEPLDAMVVVERDDRVRQRGRGIAERAKQAHQMPLLAESRLAPARDEILHFGPEARSRRIGLTSAAFEPSPECAHAQRAEQ